MPFIDTSRLEVKEPREGWKGRFFHSRNMTFAYYSVKAGSSIHEHSHPNDEVPNTPHSVRALTDAQAIVVDHPVRDSIGGVDLR